MNKTVIDQAYLRANFRYEDGELIRVTSCFKRDIGKRLGQLKSRGYVEAHLAGQYPMVHRLIWIFHFGDTNNAIDHINGIRDDNRIENLRECTAAQNQMNRHRIQGAIALKGVTVHSCGKYQAQIKVEGRNVYLGLHATPEAAAAAYGIAAIKNFGGFAQLGRKVA